MSTAPATSSVERFTITSLVLRIGRWINELNRTEAPQTHVGCLHSGCLAQRAEFPIELGFRRGEPTAAVVAGV